MEPRTGYKPLIEALAEMAEDISGLEISSSRDPEDPCLKIHLRIRTKDAYRKWALDKSSILHNTNGLKIYKRSIDLRSLILKYYLS